MASDEASSPTASRVPPVPESLGSQRFFVCDFVKDCICRLLVVRHVESTASRAERVRARRRAVSNPRGAEIVGS